MHTTKYPSRLALRLANLLYMVWYLDRRLRWQQYQIHLMPRVVISQEISIVFSWGKFGEVATEVQIYIDGQRCEDAQHHGWDQFDSISPLAKFGTAIYIMHSARDNGWEKEIYIEVAETSALFTSPRGEESISKIHARCFEGFYGQLNEFV